MYSRPIRSQGQLGPCVSFKRSYMCILRWKQWYTSVERELRFPPVTGLHDSKNKHAALKRIPSSFTHMSQSVCGSCLKTAGMIVALKECTSWGVTQKEPYSGLRTCSEEKSHNICIHTSDIITDLRMILTSRFKGTVFPSQNPLC